MKKRFKLSSGRSKSMFSRAARGIHKRNFNVANPMRGGIRL